MRPPPGGVERREALRCWDEVWFRWSILDGTSELELALPQEFRLWHRLVQLKDLGQDLPDWAALERECSPPLLNHLQGLERRLSLLTECLRLRGNEQEPFPPTERVELSETGIAFYTLEPLKPHTRLGVHMVLQPHFCEVKGIVSVLRQDVDIPRPYRTACQWITLSTADQAAIARQVRKLQRLHSLAEG